MASTRLTVDDVDPFIFSSGAWDSLTNTGAHENTLSLTRRAGAYKVVRFIGTSITVFGGLQPVPPNTPGTTLIVAQFSIDNGSPTTYRPKATTSYEWATYYTSPTLPNGEHILMMMNVEEHDLIWLDYFLIEGPQPQLLPSDGARIPSAGGRPLSSTVNPSIPPTVTSVVLSTVTFNNTPLTPTVSSTHSAIHISSHSIPPHLTSTPSSSSNTSATNPTGAITTLDPTIIIIPQDTSTSNSKDHVSTATMIGGIIGSLSLVLIIVGIIIITRRRKRRQAKQSNDSDKTVPEIHEDPQMIEPLNRSSPSPPPFHSQYPPAYHYPSLTQKVPYPTVPIVSVSSTAQELEKGRSSSIPSFFSNQSDSISQPTVPPSTSQSAPISSEGEVGQGGYASRRSSRLPVYSES